MGVTNLLLHILQEVFRQLTPPHTFVAQQSYLCIFNGFCLPLGLISCCGTLFITKDVIWPLICLLSHLLSVQNLKFRLVSWILTMVKSDDCLLSSILVSLPVLCYVLPLVYLSFCPWHQWLMYTMIYARWSFEYCVHLEGIYPSVFFIQLPYPSPALFHVVPLARKSNSRSHSLPVVIYALTNLLNKTEDKEREKMRVKIFQQQTSNFTIFFLFVLWWIVIYDEYWITLKHHCLSCPFQTLREDRFLEICLVVFFLFSFS